MIHVTPCFNNPTFSFKNFVAFSSLGFRYSIFTMHINLHFIFLLKVTNFDVIFFLLRLLLTLRRLMSYIYIYIYIYGAPRVINSSQRPLPDNTRHSQQKYPCPRWDSNPRSRQVSGLITRPEESYRLWCVVVCDLETSRIGAPYIYDISNLRVNDLTLILPTWRKW